MRDYALMVKILRSCAENSCEGCPIGGAEYTSKDCRKVHNDAADAIEELLAKVPTWISVEERLPEDGEFVLVCNDDGHMMIAKHESEVYEWYYKYTNYDFDIWDNEEQGPVLWWMPLPTPPKGVE